jgi:hypothetical protein
VNVLQIVLGLTRSKIENTTDVFVKNGGDVALEEIWVVVDFSCQCESVSFRKIEDFKQISVHIFVDEEFF